MYEKRDYRKEFNHDLVLFNVCIKETDLMIGCDKNLEKEALREVRKTRSIINSYIENNPVFLTSLKPVDCNEDAHQLIKDMIYAGKLANTGPMAAVAGTVSMYVGRKLKEYSKQVFVENGGDIYIDSHKDRKIGIYAGNSPLSNKFMISLKADMFPLGICTSSGTVGHSYSMGNADAVVILSKDTALADAVATAACNKITKEHEISKALEWAYDIDGIIGAVAIMNDKIGAIGDIELAHWNKAL